MQAQNLETQDANSQEDPPLPTHDEPSDEAEISTRGEQREDTEEPESLYSMLSFVPALTPSGNISKAGKEGFPLKFMDIPLFILCPTARGDRRRPFRDLEDANPETANRIILSFKRTREKFDAKPPNTKRLHWCLGCNLISGITESEWPAGLEHKRACRICIGDGRPCLITEVVKGRDDHKMRIGMVLPLDAASHGEVNWKDFACWVKTSELGSIGNN